MIWFILFIIAFALFILIAESKWHKFLLIVALVFYIGVELKLNDNVRTASTHGNTKHGWYSKNNKTERFLVHAWTFGFPVGMVVIASFFISRRED